MSVLLRSIAVLIAIAGALDPAWSVSRPDPQPLIAIRMASAPSTVEQSLRNQLPGRDVIVREAASRLPCGSGERCVVIADGTIDASIPADLKHPLSLVTLSSLGPPNVAVRSVSLSRTHQSASGIARVDLAADGVDGKQTEIRILDGAAVVGSTTHQWNTPIAIVDIPWWPIDAGARVLRVEAIPIDGEQTTIDNQIDVGVSVATARSPVLVFDTRPSWGSTFVRRAIEDDARFTVGYRSRLAPSLSAGTANGRLDAATLDAVSVVVAGGPDALTETDVRLLEQFVTVRGGTLILLPERPPAGPSARLFEGPWSEHLIAAAESIGPLHATEILRLDRPPLTAAIFARSGAAGAVVAMPSGNGRIVVAGAMDAWRYRDLDANSFDAFWRSLVAEAAAQGGGLQMRFDQDLAAVGSRVVVTVRDQRMTPVLSSDANATARCGSEGASTIRLWPSGVIGEFLGEVPLSVAGSCTVEATVGDRHVAGAIAVAARPLRGIDRTLARLARAVKESGGVVAAAGEEATIARALMDGPASSPLITAIHPMHSAWWIMPFAACLSLEWWLRRRNGLM